MEKNIQMQNDMSDSAKKIEALIEKAEEGLSEHASSYFYELCDRAEFRKAGKLLAAELGGKHDAQYLILYKIVTVYNCNGALCEFCDMLLRIAKDMISFKRFETSKQLSDGIEGIRKNLNYYTDDVLYYFSQTLEVLYAMGYTSLGMDIYCIYQHIRSDDLYGITGLNISKELSCVYVIDNDNKYEIAKKCQKVNKKINKSGNRHFEGLCFYYIGLVDEFDHRLFRNKDMCDDCWIYGYSGYMNKSANQGFKLAKLYLKHHSGNLAS